MRLAAPAGPLPDRQQTFYHNYRRYKWFGNHKGQP
jgi:hypothetical protein